MERIDSEKLITIAEACALEWLPRKLTRNTLNRWAVKGIRGIKLESRRACGGLCTSDGAMRRFTAALAALPIVPRKARGKQKREARASHARASAELDAMGI